MPNSVQNQKPAPDLFLHATQQLSVLPENCIVVEDAKAGITAALAANMTAVGIGPAERVGQADLILPNLDGITWQKGILKPLTTTQLTVLG